MAYNSYAFKKNICFIGTFSDSIYINPSTESQEIANGVFNRMRKNKTPTLNDEIYYCEANNILKNYTKSSKYKYFIIGLLRKKNNKENIIYYIVANNVEVKGKAFRLMSFEDVYKYPTNDYRFYILLNKKLKKLKKIIKKIKNTEKFTTSEYFDVIRFLSRYENYKCKNLKSNNLTNSDYKANNYFENIVLLINKKLLGDTSIVDVVKLSSLLYDRSNKQYDPNFESLFASNSKNWHYSGQLIRSYILLLKIEKRIRHAGGVFVMDEKNKKDLFDSRSYLLNIQNNDTLPFKYTDYERKVWSKFDINLDDFSSLIKRKVVTLFNIESQLEQVQIKLDSNYFEQAISILNEMRNGDYYRVVLDSLINKATADYNDYVLKIENRLLNLIKNNEAYNIDVVLSELIKNPFIYYKFNKDLVKKLEEFLNLSKVKQISTEFNQYWNSSLKFNYINVAEYKMNVQQFKDSLIVDISIDSNYYKTNSNGVLFQTFSLSQFRNDNIDFISQMLNSFIEGLNNIDSNFNFKTQIDIKGSSDNIPYNRKFSSMPTEYINLNYNSCNRNDIDGIKLSELAYGSKSNSYSKNCVLAYLRALNVYSKLDSENSDIYMCGNQDTTNSPLSRSVKIQLTIRITKK